QRGVDCKDELSLHLLKPRDRAVVHPEPVAIPERMTIAPLYGCSGRGAHVCEHEAGSNVPRKITEILIAPSGLDAFVESGAFAFPIPANTKAVAVRRLSAKLRMQTLVDQRVFRPIEEFLQDDGRSRVCKPTAHRPLFCCWSASTPRSRNS